MSWPYDCPSLYYYILFNLFYSKQVRRPKTTILFLFTFYLYFFNPTTILIYYFDSSTLSPSITLKTNCFE